MCRIGKFLNEYGLYVVGGGVLVFTALYVIPAMLKAVVTLNSLGNALKAGTP